MKNYPLGTKTNMADSNREKTGLYSPQAKALQGMPIEGALGGLRCDMNAHSLPYPARRVAKPRLPFELRMHTTQ